MKKVSLLFFTILAAVLFLNTPLAAAQTDSQANNANRNFQRIIPLTSPIYREMDRLYLLAGKSRPSLSRPWSADEARKIFEALPENFLDTVPASAALIKREIGFGNENTGPRQMAFKVSPEINIAANVKINNDRKEWEHGYEARPPLLNIPLEFWFFPNVYANMEFAQRHDYAIIESNRYFTNISFNPADYDWNTPFRAFLSVGGEHWNIQAGRDRVSWGAGVTGNLMISDYSDFFNKVRITTYWRRFKFTYVYMGLEPWLTRQEEGFRDTVGNEFRWSGPFEDFGERFKAHLGKRIEIRILDNLTFAISESSMFGNRYINLSELNPVMYWHNLFTPEYSNVMMGFDIDFTPFPGLNIYLQIAIDEFENSGGKPRAWAYLGGVTYVRQTTEGFLTFNLEGAIVEPYMYNRWHPNTRFTNRRRIMTRQVEGGQDFVNKPIGYRHGPDSVIIYGAVHYERPGRYMAGISVRYALLGAWNDSLDYAGTYPDEGERGVGLLSGIVERNLVVGLHGRMQLTDRISLASDIYYVRIHNYQPPPARGGRAERPERTSGTNITDLEFTGSVRIRF
ncbi:MAG: capsule assembly Wzi family protein [Spirochaetes bacterium]|nr:capsule assembly Wzi family protein [Spirochaetota bacterium]